MIKFLCGFTCLFLIYATAAAQHDSLFMYAQPPLVGEFKSVKLGVISFDATGIGVIDIKKYKVKSLSAHADLLRIETTTRKTYYGKICPSANEGNVVILSGDSLMEIDIDSISVMTYARDKFGDRISGNVSVGFNYSKSTSIGKLNIDTRIKYTSRKYDVSLTGSTITSFAGDSSVRETERLGLQGSYYLSTSWLFFTALNYQRNIELGILRRYQQGLGIGNKVLLKPNLSAVVLSGIMLNEEKSIEKNDKRILAEIPVIIYFDFFHYGAKTIEFNVTQSTFFSLSQKGRIRNDGQVNFSWEVIKDFWLTFIFYNNYDSKPPNNTDTKFDYSVVMGIKYKF